MSNKVCVPNKTQGLRLSMFNMTTGVNELKTLAKHISCEYMRKCDGRKCNSYHKWNNNKYRCECKKKNIINVKNIIFGILLLVVAKIVNSCEVLSTIHC